MPKPKRKLTPAQKKEKERIRREYMTIFVNGKQKRVKRPTTIEGMDEDEFIRRNADPIWLHQNEMWEYMEQPGEQEENHFQKESPRKPKNTIHPEDDLPF